MLSYAAGPTSPPLLEETIGANLERTVAADPDAEALVEVATGARWSYGEFNAEIDRVARGLLALGVERGTRVGIWAPNCAQWVLVQYATAKIGGILVNINPAYRTNELAYALNQSGVHTLISATAFKRSDYTAMVAAVREDCPDLRQSVFLGTDSWDALLDGASSVAPDRLRSCAAELDNDDPINIQYTSGTTGFPKGATLSHRNILNNGFFVTELLGLTAADRMCLPVPFYHCFGMVMGNLGATSHGATIVIPAPGFDAAATLAAVQAERCTVVYGVPTMFAAMLAEPSFADRDLSTLRTGIMSGASCPAELMTRCIEEMHMTGVAICYGMTETSPVSCQTRPDDDLQRRTETVGRVHPHVEIKLVDPATGATVPRGVPGEFCTRGYSVMRGYWADAQRSAAVIDDDGWLHSGDLAVMREDGYCRIVGRIKEMVIRGGENIYPREVEEFLQTHPDIVEAAVVGVPDDRYGEELYAWLRLRPGSAVLDVAAVAEFARGRIAHFKVPRYVGVVAEFPMTVTGKIRKVDLRSEAVRLLGL